MRRIAEVGRPAALIWTLLICACGPVEPDHPLDPDTPAAQQQPSRIAGRLVAPAGADPDRFADARVELWTAVEGPGDDIVSTASYAAPVDAAGRFRFDAVRPGVYRLDARTPTLAADPLLLDVPFGEVIDLGTLVLEPQWGTLTGRVLGADEQPLPETSVAARDSRVAAGPDGRFSLVLPAGTVTLTASAPGHRSVARDVEITAGAETPLAAPLTLDPLPARIEGRVDLRRFSSPERRAAITLELDDGAEIVAPVDGAFVFDDLAAGPHVVVARATGYDPIERHVDLAPGETRTLDPIALPHGSTGPDAVWLDARVEATDGAPLAGVSVAVRIGEVPFARAVSDRDGWVTAAADRADRYWLDVEPEGFAPATLGPLVWDDASRAFRGLEGARPVLTLQPLP